MVLCSAALGEHLSVKTYTIADGLARDFVNRIEQDANGYIWFCTSEGISRFDGYTFKNYGLADGLPHRFVTDILITHNNRYLFGTENGLVSFDPVNVNSRGFHFTPIPLSDKEKSNSVSSLAEDRNGIIWAGTAVGLFRLSPNGDSWDVETIDSDPATGEPLIGINSIYQDKRGPIWVATASSGLYRILPDRTFEHYTVENGLAQNGISSVFQDRDGTVWVASGTGVSRLVDDPRPNSIISARNYYTKDGLLNDFVETMFQSSDGRLWVGTRGGLSFLKDANDQTGNAFGGYGPENGIPRIRILSIVEDSDKNLWVGAENGGAIKIPSNGFVSYLEADGFGSGRIGQIFAGNNGDVYSMAVEAAALKPLILRYDGNKFIREKPPLPDNEVLTWGWNQLIDQGVDNHWWIPTANGVYQFSGDSPDARLSGSRLIKLYGKADGLLDAGIFRLFEDSRGNIWFSTLGDPDGSLHMIEKATGKLRVMHVEGLFPALAATAFVSGPDGDMWIGFYSGGIARYHNGVFKVYTESDGAPPGFVRDLYFDSKHRLWIASSIGGVSHVDDVNAETLNFVNLTTKDGISSDQVTTVSEDKWGRIYFGTGRGIDRLNLETRKLTHFTTLDGLPDNFINVSFADRDGVQWFGTLRGLARFVPQEETRSAPPPILINAVNIAGEKLQLSELGQQDVRSADLGYTKNQVQIEFVSVGFSPGETVKYQYSFENSTEWSTPAAERSVTFANLAAGSYRFLVRAIRSDGTVSPTPATVTFRILPPFWESWWFITLVTLAVVLLAIAFYRYRTARLREINFALEDAARAEARHKASREERIVELENVRSRIATDLHDDIGASLTQIAILSEVANQQAAIGDANVTKPLKAISDVSNELVGTMSDIVWAINPARDHLRDLLQRMRRFASDVLSAKDIEFEFTAPAVDEDIAVGTNLRREVFLIFKETINNIVKHSAAEHVEIRASLSDEYFDLAITDDGQGFTIPDLSPQLYSEGVGGNGIANMRRRAAEMNGEFEIVSSPGSGTTIKLRLPLDNRAAAILKSTIQSGGDIASDVV